MAGPLRLNTLTSYLLTLLSCLLLLLAHANNVCAAPFASESLSSHDVDLAAHHWKRVAPIVVSSEVGDNVSVINPATDQTIPQGPGTDGGGTDFSLPAIIWLAFVFIVGVPLALAGVRLWRFTTGMGIGLAVTICCACRAIITIVVARGTDGPLFGPSGSVGGVREYRGRRRSLGHRPYCDRRWGLCRRVCIRHAQLRTVGRHSPYRRARWALDWRPSRPPTARLAHPDIRRELGRSCVVHDHRSRLDTVQTAHWHRE